jgi:hypothetical protein
MIGPRVAYSPNKAFQAVIKRVFCRSRCVLATCGPRMTAHGRKLFYKSKFRDEPSLESAKRRQKAPFGAAIRGVHSSLKCWWLGISKRFGAGTWHAVPFADIDETAVLSARQPQLADENRRSGEADGRTEPNRRQRMNQRSGNCHAAQRVPGSRSYTCQVRWRGLFVSAAGTTCTCS